MCEMAVLCAPLGHYVSANENCFAIIRSVSQIFSTKNTIPEIGYGIFGGESEIRTRASGITRTNPLAGGPLIASWVFLQSFTLYGYYRALI